MIKRSLSIFLCLTALLGCMATVACGGTGDAESATQTATENATEAVADTDPVTCVHEFGAWVTDGKDGSLARICAKCDTAEHMSREQNIARIYENTQAFVTEVIGYGSPEAVFEDSYEYIFSFLKDSGMTGIICGSFAATSSFAEFVHGCKKVGLDVYPDCSGLSSKAVVNRLKMIDGLLDSIKGLYLKDEPSTIQFADIAETAKGVREAFPDMDWDMAPNLFPYVLSSYPAGAGKQYTWEGAAQATFDIIDADFLSFDYYPWSSSGSMAADTPQKYVANCLLAKYVADNNGKPYWTYLQTCATGGTVPPNREQVLLNTHLSLACGAEKLLIFTAFHVSEFTGLLSQDLEPQEIAEHLKNATAHIRAMKGVYHEFTTEAVIPVHLPAYEREIAATSARGYVVGQYNELLTVDTSDTCLVGCGKDADGNTGLYLVNTEYKAPEAEAKYTLIFDRETTYQVWGVDGLEQIGIASEVTLTVPSADAKYIILGRSLTE